MIRRSKARARLGEHMIRSAERSDINELADLWARAFPGERTVAQRIAQLEMGGVYGGIETAWLAERAGRMVGAFRAYALTQHVHGGEYRMMGLAAVAVDETARRRGVGGELCRHAVHIARERGDVLSVLYPFRPAFYEALGWGTVGELHVYRFRPESLVVTGEDDVRRAAAEDSAGIASCYADVARASNGMIRRTARIWRQHLDAAGVQAYVTGGGSVDGYALVRFGRGASPDERPMYVRELVATDGRAYGALLGWIAAQRDAWRIVIYEATPDERFVHRLADPRSPGFQNVRNLWAPVARVVRGPMLRLLDVTRALQERSRWGPARPLQFRLHVTDAIVPENDGLFAVDFDGDRVSVRRASGADGGSGPLLRMPVHVLAQLWAGEFRVMEAVALGRAQADGDVSGVDTLFRTGRCFRLLDEF
jgi:predicted acetyltransferase